MRPLFALACVLVLSTLLAAPADAQVRLEGAEHVRELDPVRELLARDDYLVLNRDTTFGPDTSIDADVVILDASVRLEGVIRGQVAVLGPDGALFVRPGARVQGTVYAVAGIGVISGLAYPVDLREIYVAVSSIEILPDGRYVVHVETAPPPPLLALPGIYGLWLPTYDRVDGLSIPFQVRLNPFRREGGPEVTGRLTLRTARGALDGGITVRQQLGAWNAEATLERTTETEDRWAQGDLTNTASALFLGSDSREYYRTDRAVVRLSSQEGFGLVAQELRVTPFLEARHSRDRSLPSASPWSLFGSLDRPNAPIDDGTLTSVVPGADVAWLGASTRFLGTTSLERSLGGDATSGFTLAVLDGRWDMDAFLDHRLGVRFHVRRPLGDGPAPRQRWTQLGGSATLPVFPVGYMRGDHVSFVRSAYRIPVEIVRLPLVGFPELRLLHAAGMARVTGEPSRPWEQNLGIGVRLLVLTADAWVDPAAEAFSPKLIFGITAPF